jgi:hypothetical protein
MIGASEYGGARCSSPAAPPKRQRLAPMLRPPLEPHVLDESVMPRGAALPAALAERFLAEGFGE